MFVVGAVPRWFIPRHCRRHTCTQCWGVAWGQERWTCAG